MTQATLVTVNITKIVQAKTEDGGETNEAYQTLKNQVEPPFFTELLTHTEGNKTHAARIAGMDRSTLGRKLKHHAICVDDLLKKEAVKS